MKWHQDDHQLMMIGQFKALSQDTAGQIVG
jgi:hypothetical protein